MHHTRAGRRGAGALPADKWRGAGVLHGLQPSGEMTIEWRRRALHITWLPVASMGRLASCAPLTDEEEEVLAALLAGAKVCMSREALEYKRYRKTASREIYTRLAGLERRLREMGICVTRTSGR